MLDVLIGAIVGGAFTIVGGFLGAWFQTARSDDIAQAIRRAQRREDALLALHAKTGEVYDAVTNILKAAKERGQTTAQYVAVLAKLRELSELWLWQSMVAIPDASIGSAYLKLDETVRGLLPDGQAAIDYFQQLGPNDVLFVNNLQTVVGLLRDFRDAVQVQTVGLLYPNPASLRRRLRPFRASEVRAIQQRMQATDD